MSCGVGCARGSDLALLWLWGRPVAIAPIQSLAWEPPYATDAALKDTHTKKVLFFQPYSSTFCRSQFFKPPSSTLGTSFLFLQFS